MGDKEKLAALTEVSNGTPFYHAGKAKFRIANSLVHVRFCSENRTATGKFKFGINPNTLSADFELWVCGNASTYYLIPISVIRNIYDNPDTYQDNTHPGIKVVTVDILNNSVLYAKGGVSTNLCRFLNAQL